MGRRVVLLGRRIEAGKLVQQPTSEDAVCRVNAAGSAVSEGQFLMCKRVLF